MIAENKIANFKAWLSCQGASILQPTNEFEVLRFQCKIGTGVIYKGKNGISVNSEMVNEAYGYFIDNTKGPWPGKGKPTKRQAKSKHKIQLMMRDGNECFYCGQPFELAKLTQEHFVALILGGPDRLENKVLACWPCNQAAGNMSVIDKVKLRDKRRGEK